MGNRNPWLLNRRLRRDLAELKRRNHTIEYSFDRKSQRYPVKLFIDNIPVTINAIHAMATECRRQKVLTKKQYEYNWRRERKIKLDVIRKWIETL